MGLFSNLAGTSTPQGQKKNGGLFSNLSAPINKEDTENVPLSYGKYTPINILKNTPQMSRYTPEPNMTPRANMSTVTGPAYVPAPRTERVIPRGDMTPRAGEIREYKPSLAERLKDALPHAVREGLLGRGQFTDDEGLIGFLAPTLGKDTSERIMSRYDALVKIGTRPSDALDIAATHTEPLWKRTSLELTEEQQKALSGVERSEAVDVAFLGTDIASFGSAGAARNLSTKVLDRLGSRPSVSKQFILDLTNQPDLKQPERELIRKMLEGEGDTVDVKQFTEKVQVNLLPLKPTTSAGGDPRYEDVTLPSELRGNVANYEERVYQSPVKTSAGSVHFISDGTDNAGYFAHSRIEDMADGQIRRVIEVQSDLYQKGNLEKEKGHWEIVEPTENLIKFEERVGKDEARRLIEERNKLVEQKLGQYNNPTAHFRIIREEVKKAAQDGKRVLQFPTGETAMKIEGLGEQPSWRRVYEMEGRRISDKLEVADLRIGETVQQYGDEWVITDVLGDGKFKAVPTREIQFQLENDPGLFEKYLKPEGEIRNELSNVTVKKALSDGIFADNGLIETFDISGKVDQSNPIYKFYEKEVGKYLKNNYKAELVTDAQGVKWWQMNVPKEAGEQPVLAFNRELDNTKNNGIRPTKESGQVRATRGDQQGGGSEVARSGARATPAPNPRSKRRRGETGESLLRFDPADVRGQPDELKRRLLTELPSDVLKDDALADVAAHDLYWGLKSLTNGLKEAGYTVRETFQEAADVLEHAGIYKTHIDDLRNFADSEVPDEYLNAFGGFDVWHDPHVYGGITPIGEGKKWGLMFSSSLTKAENGGANTMAHELPGHLPVLYGGREYRTRLAEDVWNLVSTKPDVFKAIVTQDKPQLFKHWLVEYYNDAQAQAANRLEMILVGNGVKDPETIATQFIERRSRQLSTSDDVNKLINAHRSFKEGLLKDVDLLPESARKRATEYFSDPGTTIVNEFHANLIQYASRNGDTGALTALDGTPMSKRVLSYLKGKDEHWPQFDNSTPFDTAGSRNIRPLEEINTDLDQKRIEHAILQDDVKGDPVRKLMRFAGSGDNSLAEINTRALGTNKKSATLDQIVTELGYKDLDEAQTAIEQYRTKRDRLFDLEDQIADLRSEVKALKQFDAEIAEANIILDDVENAAPYKEYEETGKVVTEARKQYKIPKTDALIKTIDPLNPGNPSGERITAWQNFKKAANGAWDSLRETVEDDWFRVKKLQRQTGVKVTDEANPYMREILYHGRVGAKIEEGRDIAKAIDRDLVETARGVSVADKELIQDVNEFLVARHAPERNAVIGDGAAGITTQQAQEVMARIDALPHGSEVRRIADKIQDLNNQTLDLLKEGGVITEELYATLKSQYKHHIPLYRILPESEDIGGMLSGKGFNVRSTGIKKAKGSDLDVADIMSNVLYNYEQAVLRSEKNIVDNATLAFARNNKELAIFEELSPKVIGKTFDGQPITERITDPTVLQMFENGKKVYLKINDPALATAFQAIGRQQLPALLRIIGTYTRWYSGLATRFNPEFAFTNKVRDLQEAMTYMAAKGNMKDATTVPFRDPASAKAIVDYLRGADSDGAKLYRQMIEDGGTTGGMGLSTRKQAELDIDMIRRENRSNPRKAAVKLVDYVDNWNRVFEDSTRLSVYKASLAQGMSRDQAAVLAKEASVNFNKMGTGGPVINSLYMFSNASIQGSAKMLRAMKNPKVAGAVVATVGASVWATNEWNDMMDPEWRDKITAWDRLNSLPVILPPGEDGSFNYFVIPVSWGIKPIKVAADYAFDAAYGKMEDVNDAFSGVFAALIEGYNPVGGTDMVSAVTPTILDAGLEIARNQAWSGGVIRPDWDKNAPDSIQYFDDLRDSVTGETAILISKGLSGIGQEVSPANIYYAYEQLIGGAGRAVNRLANTITSIAGGEGLPDNQIPFVSRFVRSRSAERIGAGTGGNIQELQEMLGNQSKERFYLKQQAEDSYQQLKNIPKEEAAKRFDELSQADPQLAKKVAEVAEDEKLGLSYQDRLIKQLGVENGERARFLVKKFNELKTKEEKAALWEEYTTKKIMSEQVQEQVIYLLNSR
jgi:hypothetical protein